MSHGKKLRENSGHTERSAQEVFTEETRHDAQGTVFGQSSFIDAVSHVNNLKSAVYPIAQD